jgi:ribose transport system substrate-binding protein
VVDRFPNLKLVARQTADFDRSRALDVMETILQAHPDIKAVFCGNDAMALGAYQALRGAGRADTVKVFGFDGSQDALREINAGQMSATAMQYPQVMAAKAAEFASRYLHGDHNLPRRVAVAVDLVTAANVSQFQQ